MRGTNGRLQETSRRRKLRPETCRRFRAFEGLIFSRARREVALRRRYFFFDDFFAAFFAGDFFFGTFAPALRASDNPMAMACLRLLTLPPLPPLPDLSVPCFRRRMALATVFCAPFPYLRRDDDFFFPGMQFLLKVREIIRA